MAKLTAPIVVDWDDIKEHVKDYLPHWIPCSEELPEKAGKYLVTAKPTYSHSKEIVKAYWSGGRWLGYCQQEILAWMPLPEPYQEVEHELGNS